MAAVAAAATLLPRPAHSESQIERGHYLAVVAGCNDCHTPGFFLGKPDEAKYLGGSDVGFEILGLGARRSPNHLSNRASTSRKSVERMARLHFAISSYRAVT